MSSGQISDDITIAAISTPPGVGGVGIVRMSGSLSFSILEKIFLPKNSSCSYQSHKLYYGQLVDPFSGKMVDEVLAVFMRGPNSYTREDVVELHCHGSYLVLENTLKLVLECGAQLAAPGEFTKRAFLNGRIDLTQAEAVVDILSAKTQKGVDLGLEQLSGALYRRIEPCRQSLVRAKAVVEVAIDFPDDDVEIVDHSQLVVQLTEEVQKPLQKLLKGAGQGKLYRNGVSLVIAGRPNVGKSSLLNALLQEDRALVTSVPGTTRDSIEEIIDISGIPVRIIDTAGIREGVCEVEELGIERARELINRADFVVFLIDGATGVTEEDRLLYEQVAHKPLVPVVNKSDLCGDNELDLSWMATEVAPVVISARNQDNIEGLRNTLFAQITSAAGVWEEDGCAPNLRHKLALGAAIDAVQGVLDTLGAGLTCDLVAVDLQGALDALNDIVGETTPDDVLDAVFEQFCLGK